jgi:hypothetical protein
MPTPVFPIQPEHNVPAFNRDLDNHVRTVIALLFDSLMLRLENPMTFNAQLATYFPSPFLFIDLRVLAFRVFNDYISRLPFEPVVTFLISKN